MHCHRLWKSITAGRLRGLFHNIHGVLELPSARTAFASSRSNGEIHCPWCRISPGVARHSIIYVERSPSFLLLVPQTSADISGRIQGEGMFAMARLPSI